eukprot:4721082-Pyramimonas_sp.AAC.1
MPSPSPLPSRQAALSTQVSSSTPSVWILSTTRRSRMGVWGVVCTLAVTGTGGPVKTENVDVDSPSLPGVDTDTHCLLKKGGRIEFLSGKMAYEGLNGQFSSPTLFGLSVKVWGWSRILQGERV